MEVGPSIYLPEFFSDGSHNLTARGKPIFHMFLHLLKRSSRWTYLGLFHASWRYPSELTTHAVYNGILAILVTIKAIMTYRLEILKGSHSQLRDIVIR